MKVFESQRRNITNPVASSCAVFSGATLLQSTMEKMRNMAVKRDSVRKNITTDANTVRLQEEQEADEELDPSLAYL